jgi:hypothetical protein
LNPNQIRVSGVTAKVIDTSYVGVGAASQVGGTAAGEPGGEPGNNGERARVKVEVAEAVQRYKTGAEEAKKHAAVVADAGRQ